MSIDHGKLLAIADEINQHKKWRASCTPRTPSINELQRWEDAIRALAQPAEAVEGREPVVWRVPTKYGIGYSFASEEVMRELIGPVGAVEGDLDLSKLEDRARRGEALAAEVNDVLGMAQHGAAWTPERAQRLADDCLQLARNVEASKHDDAAQGAVARVAWRSDPDQGTYLVAEWLGPLPEPGELLFTHPQAAPAQGGSLRHTNAHLTKSNVERNVRSSSALEGISTQTFQAAADGDKE